MRWWPLFVTLILIFPSWVYANTYHVHPDSTYSTIKAGINAASSGDTVLVHAATYSESDTLKAGVNVWSAGDGEVIINGGASYYTVYFYGNGNGMYFGKDGDGFSIRGGSRDGIYLDASNMHVVQIDVTTGITLKNCASSVVLNKITASSAGIVADSSPVTIENSTVENVSSRGISVQFTNSPGVTLDDVDIDSCGTGVWVLDSPLTYEDPNNLVSNCETGVDVWAYFGSATFSLDTVEFRACTTAVTTVTSGNSVVSAEIEDCTIDECGDGMILDGCSGSIKGCTFEDLDDDGITITDNAGTITIGGSGTDANQFDSIDGDGIHVSSNADANIDENEFDYVDETAILVDSGSNGTTIDDCDMDGTGGCFEGINTSGSGTFAEVRDCKMYDYRAHTSPAPRGAIAYKATADYGTSSDNGNNSFYDNSTDLSYQNRDANPDSLYAVKNWWGENPPNASSFAGRTNYIVYQPYLTSTPRLLPVSEPELPLPKTARLTSIHPSPSRGTVEFAYALPAPGHVTIAVLDLNGRVVRTVVDDSRSAGFAHATWDGATTAGHRAPSGIYLCRLTTAGGHDTVRFVLVR